jgi:hypothetical protein
MRSIVCAICAFTLVACGGDDGEEPSGSDPAVLDDLAEIPATPGDVYRIDVPERIVEAGADSMFCFYPPATDAEYYVQTADAYQGEYGHHLLLFRTIAPKEVGTLEDCTEASAMATFLPNIFTSEFAGGTLPDGYAVKVAAGTRIVLQQHYVNTTSKPIRVRDAVFLKKVPKESVQYEVGFAAMTDTGFEIPAKSSGIDVPIECTPPEDDTKLLLLGPHMHEWGEKIRLEKSSDGGTSWEMIQDVPEWDATFRDLPPVQRLFDSPLVLNQSDKLRVTCTFMNDQSQPLKFPQEMCAYYGYFLSPSGNSSWICMP